MFIIDTPTERTSVSVYWSSACSHSVSARNCNSPFRFFFFFFSRQQKKTWLRTNNKEALKISNTSQRVHFVLVQSSNWRKEVKKIKDISNHALHTLDCCLLYKYESCLKKTIRQIGSYFHIEVTASETNQHIHMFHWKREKVPPWIFQLTCCCSHWWCVTVMQN